MSNKERDTDEGGEMQIIEFIQHQEKLDRFLIPNAFRYNDNKGYKWVQRLCCWIMKKIGADYYDEKAAYLTKTSFNTQDFIGKIFQQKGDIQQYFNRKPKQLLIGDEDFRELMGTPEIRDMLSFHTSYNYDREICGLKVTIIPWMKGILVLPNSLPPSTKSAPVVDENEGKSGG